jgi:hypothetical protein
MQCFMRPFHEFSLSNIRQDFFSRVLAPVLPQSDTSCVHARAGHDFMQVLAALPPSMLAFHVTGGHCAGPLLVERGSGLAAVGSM